MVTDGGTGIRRVNDVVGTSSMCWILAATASTLDYTLAAGFGTMDAVDTMGTSSRSPNDAVGNAADAVGTSSRNIFSTYRLRITFFVNIMQV
jgi:hypothetical protein